jgi:hypothetical protein
MMDLITLQWKEDIRLSSNKCLKERSNLKVVDLECFQDKIWMSPQMKVFNGLINKNHKKKIQRLLFGLVKLEETIRKELLGQVHNQVEKVGSKTKI